MADTELDHLIVMANQIADNLVLSGLSQDAAAKVTDHMSRFWARSMKQQIIAYADNDGKLLQPVAREAVRRLTVNPL